MWERLQTDPQKEHFNWKKESSFFTKTCFKFLQLILKVCYLNLSFSKNDTCRIVHTESYKSVQTKELLSSSDFIQLKSDYKIQTCSAVNF